MNLCDDSGQSVLTAADLELYEERAAIREYDGNQPRPEAEAGAREDVERWRAEHDHTCAS